MKKYEVLDNAIMTTMGDQARAFPAIYVMDVANECHRIAAEEGGRNEPFLILDRRLQALRKLGQIQSTSKGWIRTPQQQGRSPCEHQNTSRAFFRPRAAKLARVPQPPP